VTANEVDGALALPIAEVGDAILSLQEDQWFDRKSIRIQMRSLAEHIVAFANADGGVIVLGASGGQVEGLRDHPGKLNEIQQCAVDYTSPPVRIRVAQKSCLNSSNEIDTLVVIQIEPSEVVHQTTNGNCYLRLGDETRKLTHEQRTELEYDKGQSQYDGMTVADTSSDDLDEELMRQYRDATGSNGTYSSLMKARSLMTAQGLITNAGYLLFAPHPQDRFPQAVVRVIKFLSNERGTGGRLSIEDGTDIRVEGPIPTVIERAAALVESYVPKRTALGASGRFEPVPLVPRDAWLEGLVNAVIHRSYSLGGDHIRVEVYPNRVEIESPGRFPGLADPNKPLDISRFARNPRIARVCADLRIGQELGEGIKRIFDEMRRVGLTDPIYEETAGTVRLKLQAVPRLDPRVAARLPKGSQLVLDALRATERPLSTGDVANQIGLSKPATSVRLLALQREGLVRWVGKSTKDPRAVWELTD
jgi:ATP-dependent DNA helicase RecG